MSDAQPAKKEVEDVGLLKWDPFNAFKNIYSTCLLIFSVVIVMGLIGTSQTGLSSKTNPAVAYIVCWAALIWLTSVEGTQGSFVGLAPINPEIYKESHPVAFLCNKVMVKGDNLDRYLMGRQFMVCCIVFIINMSAGPAGDVQLWGLSEGVKTAFFGVGLAMIFFTAMIGQLNSQVNASICMLDYCNNYFAVFTMWVAMAIEFTGLLHASYLISMAVNKCAGTEMETKEEPRTEAQNIFYWGRCLMSLAILTFCGVVTVYALFTGQTTIWEGIPPIVSFIIFLILMSVVGMLEAMQIAFFACAKLRADERGDSKFAKLTAHLLWKGDGNNLPGFMIGRQLTVVSCMFFVARVTSVKMKEGAGNMFGVSDGVQGLFNSGLLGALFLTIVGSIAWQLVASAFPIAFMDNPITYILLRVALAIEFTGVCNGAWVLAYTHAKIAGFQRDEVYIGTAEERAAKALRDHESNLHIGPGHMIPLPAVLPGYVDQAPPNLRALLKDDPTILEYLQSIRSKEQLDIEAGEAEDKAIAAMKMAAAQQSVEIASLKEVDRLHKEVEGQAALIDMLKNKAITPENIAKVLKGRGWEAEIVESHYIPDLVAVTESGLLKCVDGRASDHPGMNGPKALGGVYAIATNRGVTSIAGLKDIVKEVSAAGYIPSCHGDEYADPEPMGCGFFKLWSTGELDGIPPPEYDSEQGRDAILSAGGVYEKLLGKHAEKVVYINLVPDTTLKPKGDDQRFVVDAWIAGVFKLDVPTYLAAAASTVEKLNGPLKAKIIIPVQ